MTISLFSSSLFSNIAFRPKVWSPLPLASQAAAVGASFSFAVKPSTPTNGFFPNLMRFASTVRVFTEAETKRSWGRTRSISNRTLARLLEERQGDRAAVAALPAVPIKKSTITWRIVNAPPLDSLTAFRWGKMRHPKVSAAESAPVPKAKRDRRLEQLTISDAELAWLLELGEGDRDWIEKHAGIRWAQIARRLRSAPKRSALYPYRAEASSVPDADEARMAAALRKTRGNRREAAKIAGVSRRTMGIHIKNADEDSPLFPFKTQKGKPGKIYARNQRGRFAAHPREERLRDKS